MLREQDIIGQIEAVRRLHVYNEILVYEVLMTVVRSENFFYKVRKEVLKALHKMEVFSFYTHIRHGDLLMKQFNKKREISEDIHFYKENDFTNLLEHFHERHLLKAISKCKDLQLVLMPDKDKEVKDLREKRCKQLQNDNTGKEPSPQIKQAAEDSNKIKVPIVDSAIVTRSGRRQESKKMYDDAQYKSSTEDMAKMLLQVLAQNDNSNNDYDDSYYLRDLLAALGRLDNVKLMPQVAAEVYRQFKLDQISNSSA